MHADLDEQSSFWRMAHSLGAMSWLDRLFVYYVIAYSLCGFPFVVVAANRVRAIWTEMDSVIPVWMNVAVNPLALALATAVPLSILMAALREGPRLIARRLLLIAAFVATGAAPLLLASAALRSIVLINGSIR